MAARNAQQPDENPDYSNWSNADLIQRVTALEEQLRAQNAKHNPQTALPVYKKKPKKASKPFDPSKYSMRLIALKFAYVGGRYNGFEHHTNNTTPLPTIEQELWKALRKTKLIFPTFKEGKSEDDVCWDGCDYSKCGRTDRGVSAFGQVIGLRVRSSRPKEKPEENGLREDTLETNGSASKVETDIASDGVMPALSDASSDVEENVEHTWDPVRDELPYIQLLNRVLPPDIRILAWCPAPPPNFSARFNCKERRYRYFFTNPAYIPSPDTTRGGEGSSWLDIDAMQEAAAKFEGLHDFRNFCKIDPSKQITNFERRIFSAGIYPVSAQQQPGSFLDRPPFTEEADVKTPGHFEPNPQVYYFEVRGSAFLWHQVRHLVAMLFLVGQRYEDPSIVDKLLNVQDVPSKPMYEMASDVPLVLWDCVFPDAEESSAQDHGGTGSSTGYQDAMNWIYVGDEAAVGNKTKASAVIPAMQDRKYGRLGIMDDLWSMWRNRKIEEVLAGSLLEVVARQGKTPAKSLAGANVESSARAFDGGDLPRTVGKYTPMMQRERMETADVVNARYAVRKGLNKVEVDADVDE